MATRSLPKVITKNFNKSKKLLQNRDSKLVMKNAEKLVNNTHPHIEFVIPASINYHSTIKPQKTKLTEPLETIYSNSNSTNMISYKEGNTKLLQQNFPNKLRIIKPLRA